MWIQVRGLITPIAVIDTIKLSFWCIISCVFICRILSFYCFCLCIIVHVIMDSIYKKTSIFNKKSTWYQSPNFLLEILPRLVPFRPPVISRSTLRRPPPFRSPTRSLKQVVHICHSHQICL